MKKQIREYVKKQRFKIGNETLKKIEDKAISASHEIADKAIRNAKLSGRKTIKIKDLDF